jgi:cystathionine beta-lyase/cystathionine gamma-synthase
MLSRLVYSIGEFMSIPFPNLSSSTASLMIDRDLSEDLGIAADLHQSVAYGFLDHDHKTEMSRPFVGMSYTRRNNPTNARLSKVIAHLERAETGMMFASGVGAIATSLMALTAAGDHIVAQINQFSETTRLMESVLGKFGIGCTRVDQSSPAAFEAAIRPTTKVIWIETPSNPLGFITDIAAIAKIAKSRGITSIADNTLATPINQRPHDFGIDLVVHSVSKYIGGHHDLLAGCITGPRGLVERIWDISYATGATAAPFNSWLALRGIRTLELRVVQQNKNGLALAQFLHQHNAVKKVYYPGLSTHPQHELASRQMSGFGGVVTFDLKGGHDAAQNFIKRMKIPTYSGGLGGVTSTVLQPAVFFGNRVSADNVDKQGLTAGMIRLCVGIENTKDLLDDFAQALT